MSEFIINPNRCSGYPSIDTIVSDFTPVQDNTYPKRVFYMSTRVPKLLDGYPVMVNWKDFTPAQDNTYPCNMFEIDDNKMSGYPSFSFFGNFSPVQSRPYPVDIMSCTTGLVNGYPSFYTYGEFSPVMTAPHPREIMSCDPDVINGYPKYAAGNPFITWGAGKWSENMEEISIPKSVLWITDYAFWGTKLKRVRMNRHCIYFEHSFPPGCVLIPYKENE